jgi:hypothetical protein
MHGPSVIGDTKMNRTEATKFLRQLLDEHGLSDWRVTLTNNERYMNIMGMCVHDKKTIILNAFHVDTHPSVEVLDTIRHEVAHALTPNDRSHGAEWRLKAKSLGANPTQCATYGVDPVVLDAFRSGAQVEVIYEEEVIVNRTPKYHITRLQDKCKICGKVAKVVKTSEIPGFIFKTLECGHVDIVASLSKSRFETLVFDGLPTCKHKWGEGKHRAECSLCGAHRLFDFQVEGCRALERANGRMAIFDEQGLGKTIQPLAYLKFNPDAFPYLWVTKSKIKYQHSHEIVRILGIEYYPQILETSKQRLIKHKNMKGYMISYDMFRRLDVEMFKDVGIQTIIVDECQAIKNPDSARTQALREVVRNIPRVIPTSGTFWKNKGSEAFVALNMLDPKMFWSFADFKRRHVKYVTDPMTGKEREGGFKDPEKFRQMISHIAIRRTRKEVLPDLPLVNRTKLYCEVPEHARNVLNEEVKNIKNIYNAAAIDGTEESWEVKRQLNESIMKMRQIVGLAKVPTIVEYLQEFLENGDEKIVCFVHHIKVGEIIASQMQDWCKEEGEELPLQILGGMAPSDVTAIQDSFNYKKPRLLIASTLAGGEGLNLQRACHTLIMAERQWNAANEQQAEDRLCRIGQEAQQIDAIYALGDKTVDTMFDALVEFRRREFMNSMDKSGYVSQWSEESIFREMIKAIVEDKVA